MAAYAFANGEGVGPNDREALAYYRAGCALDDPGSCYMVAYNLERGAGAATDTIEARALYRRALKIDRAYHYADTALRRMALGKPPPATLPE